MLKALDVKLDTFRPYEKDYDKTAPTGFHIG